MLLSAGMSGHQGKTMTKQRFDRLSPAGYDIYY